MLFLGFKGDFLPFLHRILHIGKLDYINAALCYAGNYIILKVRIAYFSCIYVPVSETVRGFKEIIEGMHDNVPESAFLYVGTIDEAVEKAKKVR